MSGASKHFPSRLIVVQPRDDAVAQVKASIESAFQFYDEDVHRQGFEQWVAECVVDDLLRDADV